MSGIQFSCPYPMNTIYFSSSFSRFCLSSVLFIHFDPFIWNYHGPSKVSFETFITTPREFRVYDKLSWCSTSVHSNPQATLKFLAWFLNVETRVKHSTLFPRIISASFSQPAFMYRLWQRIIPCMSEKVTINLFYLFVCMLEPGFQLRGLE